MVQNNNVHIIIQYLTLDANMVMVAFHVLHDWCCVFNHILIFSMIDYNIRIGFSFSSSLHFGASCFSSSLPTCYSNVYTSAYAISFSFTFVIIKMHKSTDRSCNTIFLLD